MARIKECPRCGRDISDTYEAADYDVGIMGSGWFCDACDLAVDDDSDYGGDDDYDYEPEHYEPEDQDQGDVLGHYDEREEP